MVAFHYFWAWHSTLATIDVISSLYLSAIYFLYMMDLEIKNKTFEYTGLIIQQMA